jgi:hypothetical protein
LALTPSHTILVLPGWHNSGPEHWQTRWELSHGYQRVQQHDWDRPLRGDWLIQLEESVLASAKPVVLVAHSLACIQVAAWAAHSRNTGRVHGALLVAPSDVERAPLREQLPGWSPIARQALPFSSRLVASRNDPFCSFERAAGLAQDWACPLTDAGNAGHLNAQANLGDWPFGHGLLLELMFPKQPLPGTHATDRMTLSG